MEQKDTIKDLLYEKMSNEQKDFVENLKHLPPEKIIEEAYRITLREDILSVIDSDILNAKQMSALIKTECPLAVCYDVWLKTDYSHMDDLRCVISDYADEIIKENERAKKKKRSEPER